MKYFKNINTGDVYAYSQDSIDISDGIAQLESNLQNAIDYFSSLPVPPEPDIDEDGNVINDYEQERQAYAQAQNNVAIAQNKLDNVLPVFFDIREKLKSLVEMTPEEIDAHINLPSDPEYKTQFGVLEFRDRFTIEEQLAIRQAQFDDMEVGLVYDNFQAAQFIDIEDPRVEQGIDLYIAKGLLAPERKADLLQPELIEP